MSQRSDLFQQVQLPLSEAYRHFDDPSRVSAENVTATDLDGDGLPELVFHLWLNAFNAGDTDAFVPNRLAILDSSAGGWESVTSEIITATPFAPHSLGGATRQNRVADLNGDGFSDIAWSVNQEDGRSGDSDFDAQTSLLLSRSKSDYSVEAVGTASWHHAIGARSYDADHAQPHGIVVATGYGSRQEAFIVDSVNKITTEVLPALGASTLLHLEKSALDNANVYFFTDSPDHPAILQRSPSGQWSILDEAPISDGLESRIFYDVPSWNGDIAPQRTAYKFQGEWVTGLAPDDAVEIDLMGLGDHVIVADMSGLRPEVALNGGGDGPVQYLMFFEFKDGELDRLDVPIDGYISETNRNFIDVIDVDGDGLDDIVSYDYVRSDDAPLFNVYRNTGEMRFEKLDLEGVMPAPLQTTGSALVCDFNVDGKLDILQWASDGGVQDPDEASAVIHYGIQPWGQSGGAATADSEYPNAAYFGAIQESYLGYYDRNAEKGGLEYWAGRLANAGGELDAIIDAFANSAEAQARYGEINNETIDEVVTAVYEGLFDRSPDAGGLAFYRSGFENGQFTPGVLAIDIAQGATGADAIALDNRIAMGIVDALA